MTEESPIRFCPVQRSGFHFLSPSDILGILPPDATSILTGLAETYLPQTQDVAQQIDPDQYRNIAGVGVTAVAAPQAWKLSQALQAQKKRQSAAAAGERTYPESNAATYELLDVGLPFEFGDAALVRPLLKQTQLEGRPLQVVYDANKHGYNAQTFHQKVDGKGACVVLCKAQGQWFGAYNPRGWASCGDPVRPERPLYFMKRTDSCPEEDGKSCASWVVVAMPVPTTCSIAVFIWAPKPWSYRWMDRIPRVWPRD
ncbi:TLD domain containing protein [Nitzschia inconspicua]|uniref:TLD domain containing protein n=1 Tax=Nitzschia inconspicua TaxID=303405 RepID=A0A9K3PEH4_9STRA|nr:TLD domain containing protein [Nitzschia inconspicua]